ncbi:MAG: dTDP-4-dehydrorhamnose reductase [Clostridia bacterium]|nr:dTDP-4-dehydrorhamnose reductase [Clostridia bacterium]
MKKVWIVGASGRVGSALLKQLDCLKYEIMVTDAKEVDVTNREDVNSYMKISRPDVVINCAGKTDLEACEADPDDAYRVNAIGARNLAIACEMSECKLIQLSTDDIFSLGSDGPYNEFEQANPRSVYGKSKYAGEQLVMSLSTRYVIIRSSWIYGTGVDFVSKVWNAVKTQTPMQVPINQYAVPTSAKELAKVVTYFIDHDLFGIYHAVCQGSCSRYEFAKEILKNIGRDVELIPVNTTNEARPVYSVLDNMMLRLDNLKQPAEWKTALAEYIRETGGDE